jgi:4-amino-4-deoxy-L-arabinose transferase-like glycosyltransferase
MVAPISLRFQRADKATLTVLPLLLLGVGVGWLVLRLSRLPLLQPVHEWFSVEPASRAHAVLMIAVGALMLNNVFRLPQRLGFDIVAHFGYMRFIIEHASIPIATDGWQMFQSPLYYLIAAPIYQARGWFFAPETVALLMRIPSIACGLWLIDLCYRTLRSTFPKRPELQIAGSAFAALLPVNLWITPYVGNEPMAACLTAAALLLVFRALSSPPTARQPGFQWLLGAALGLALLTKVTAALMLAPTAIAIAWALNRAGEDRAGGVAASGRIAFAMLSICGWYYGRNWVLLGSPFVGGWSDSRGIDWWQDPGYRNIGDYVRFGAALIHPFYASLAGFWDGLYSTFWLDGYTGSMITYEARPPWNYTCMLSLAWLSLPLSGIMLLSVRSLRSPSVLFSWFCVESYLLAILALHLMIPNYTQVKASYALGLAPCFCVLLVAGLEQLSARGRRYAMCWLAMWALASYAAFFVIE